jgi:hypothetical protein
LGGRGAIGLHERLAQRASDHALLALCPTGLGVAQQMNPEALPGGSDYAADSGLEILIGVGNGRFNVKQAVLNQPFQ